MAKVQKENREIFEGRVVAISDYDELGNEGAVVIRTSDYKPIYVKTHLQGAAFDDAKCAFNDGLNIRFEGALLYEKIEKNVVSWGGVETFDALTAQPAPDSEPTDGADVEADDAEPTPEKPKAKRAPAKSGKTRASKSAPTARTKKEPAKATPRKTTAKARTVRRSNGKKEIG